MYAKLGSAITGIGFRGMNKLFNFSGLVMGASLQIRILLVCGTWFSLKNILMVEAGWEGRNVTREDIIGEKCCKVFAST